SHFRFGCCPGREDTDERGQGQQDGKCRNVQAQVPAPWWPRILALHVLRVRAANRDRRGGINESFELCERHGHSECEDHAKACVSMQRADFPAFADRGRERCSARSLVWRTRGHCCGHLAHRGSGPLLCASLTKETGMATRRTTESPQGDASPKKRAPRKRATRSEQVDAPVTEAGSEVAGEARV